MPSTSERECPNNLAEPLLMGQDADHEKLVNVQNVLLPVCSPSPLFLPNAHSRFTELFGGGPAQDRVRNQRIPSGGITLDTLDEAFTSENWIVRIYKVKPEDPLGRELKAANAFDGGKRLKRSKSAGAGGKKARPSV